MMKRVFIKTYGCQMNERDSEAVAALLQQRGYVLTSREQEAEVVLVNTCSVRDLAEQKALSKLRELAAAKRHQPQLVLGVLGCMAQSRGAALCAAVPGVDLVVGTQKFHRVPDYLERLAERREPIVELGEEAGSESALCQHLLGTNGTRPVTAFVSIMQGCDMHCSFCIVPHTRGRERSRPIAEIVEEVRQLADAGVKEVTLLGQIVTSYGRGTIPKKAGKSAFVQLLEALHEVPGLERLRFTAPHPKGFGDDLVTAYRELPKLCEHAHLPVQSGSDRILRRMKRGYSRAWYLRVIDKLRAAQPAIAFSTDIIVGFPGETEADFADTLSLMQEVGFAQAYIFKYSPRRDTAATQLPDQVPAAVRERRHREALALHNALMLAQHRALVGATVEVLVEGASAKNPNRLAGRTRTNRLVVLEGHARHRGQLLPVQIQEATVSTLYGTPAIIGV